MSENLLQGHSRPGSQDNALTDILTCRLDNSGSKISERDNKLKEAQ